MLAPTVAFGQPPDALLELGPQEKKKLRATVSLSNSVGLATFVADDKADNPYLAQSVSIGPSYTLTERLTLGLGWSIGWEYTAPENQSGRRYSPSDISGSISHSRIWANEPLGLNLSGSLRAIAPTSFESRFNHTVTNVTASPSLSKSLGDRTKLTYSFGFTKYLPYRETRGFEDCSEDTTFFHPPGQPQPDTAGRCGTEGQNRNFSLRNSLGLSYRFTDKLTGLMSLGTSHGWSYAPDGGSWTKQRGIDSTSGNISVSYQVNERYTVSGGISSGQPALDRRGSRPRFPFADFETPANGFTSFGLTISGKI